MAKQSIVYDSASKQQLILEKALGDDAHNLDEYATPIGAKMLLRQYVFTVTDLVEERKRIAVLESNIESLRQRNSELSVKAGRSDERQHVLWAEIPLTYLAGIATNMIFQNGLSSYGLAVLLVCVVSTALIRSKQIGDYYENW
ncbi:MAG: hypothetical protein AAB288_04235, partial [Acidobacteriota bacterium]